MDIATQLVTALVAGAVVASKDIGNKAIQDAYHGLKSGIAFLFGPPAQEATKSIETNPSSFEAKDEFLKSIGSIQENDVARLEPQIATLIQAIAADEKARSAVESLGHEVSLTFDEVVKVNVKRIVLEGQKVGMIVTKVDSFKSDEIIMKGRLGN